MTTLLHFERTHRDQLHQDLQSADCRSVATAAAALAAAGEHVEPSVLERARHCLIPRHGGRRRIDFARAYFHLLDPDDGGREAERLLRTDTDAEIRCEAFHALIDYGERALPTVRDLASSRDATVRWYAYRAASRIRSAEALSILLAGLEDHELAPRMVAANALIERRAEAFVPLLHAIAVRPAQHGFHLAVCGVLKRVTPHEAREQVAPLLASLASPWSIYQSGFLARAILNVLARERGSARGAG